MYVLNWKTTSDSSDWTGQWQYNIQAWTEALAAEHDLGEEVTGCIFEGLYKGYKKGGVFQNPLTFGWKRNNNGMEFAWNRPKKESRKAPSWERFRTRDFPGGLWEWIKWLPSSVREKHLLRSAPILKSNHVVEHWLKQVVRKENDISYMLQDSTHEECLEYFEMSSTKLCKWCPYNGVCYGLTTMEEMIKDGKLKAREDHHEKVEGDESG